MMGCKNRFFRMAAALLIALFVFCKDNSTPTTPPPPVTSLTIKNESGIALEAVVWNGTDFGSIANSNYAERKVRHGNGRISFVITGKNIIARTQLIITVEEGAREEQKITASTWVEEINDINFYNSASLPSLRKTEPPEAGTMTAIEITRSSARLNSSVSNEGFPKYTEKGFCYSQHVSDLEFSSYCHRVEGDFKMSIDDLTPGTKYYAKAYITNGVHPKKYGNPLEFTTRDVTLALTPTPPEGGTVSRYPDMEAYDFGATVTITANAESGYAFASWTVTSGQAQIANADSAVTTATLNSNAAITANFDRTYTLTTDINPAGSGTVTRTPSQTSYRARTTVSVTAKPNAGHRFTGWTGASTSTNSTVTLNMDGDKTLTANFEAAPTHTLTIQSGGSGTVTLGPDGESLVFDGGAGGVSSQERVYEAGTTVTATATAAAGYTFVGWTGASTSTSAAVTITMDGNKALTANFQVWDGILTDPRDGQKYNTVKIGTQTWMAENLNYNASGSACYQNNESNCNTYGRLYYWNAAMSACPAGWHLPSDAEWEALVKYVDPNASGNSSNVAGTKLKSKTGWNTGTGYKAGTDNFGFSALPGAYRGTSGSFFNVGNHGNWWSATESDASKAWARNMYYNNEYVERYANDKTFMLAARCAQDLSVER